ncbi:MAG: hypothetical protein EZS28_038937, partial [Streblomastix strix]
DFNKTTKERTWNKPVKQQAGTQEAHPESEPAADLPEGWKERVDEKSKRKYYSNPSTSEKTWEKPPSSKELPSGWEVSYDKNTRKWFYNNKSLKIQQAERPTQVNFDILKGKNLMEGLVEDLSNKQQQQAVKIPEVKEEKQKESNEKKDQEQQPIKSDDQETHEEDTTNANAQPSTKTNSNPLYQLKSSSQTNIFKDSSADASQIKHTSSFSGQQGQGTGSVTGQSKTHQSVKLMPPPPPPADPNRKLTANTDEQMQQKKQEELNKKNDEKEKDVNKEKEKDDQKQTKITSGASSNIPISPAIKKPPIQVAEETGPGIVIKKLPPSLQEEIHRFDKTTFVQEHFRKYTKGFFHKVQVPPDEVMQMQSGSLKQPILIQITKEKQKQVLNNFDNILIYQGLKGNIKFEQIQGTAEQEKKRDKQMTQVAHQIVNLGQLNENFRNEIFCQLIKQTTVGSQTEKELKLNILQDALRRGWQLIMLCCETFAPQTNFESVLLAHIEKAMDA